NELAATAAATMAEFDAASGRVAEAVELIGRIAKQVNLLALNATIESARAGEHGRGFTVVAGEVKALARRTGETAEDIARRIATMRDASEKSAREVAAIRDLMREAAALVREVGQAVEQQAATTREMSSAIGKAAGDGRELGEVATVLAAIAQRGTATADTTRAAAADLQRLEADLRSVIGS
ncbi:MAG: methyl-accepting chemotaxis protein, partial [Planctomycetes bacterium]|nr:methyl-accepting chemotaxis protein [Planctomycetota bacterium]